MSYVSQAWLFVKGLQLAYWPAGICALFALVLLVLWRRQQRKLAHTAVEGKHKTSRFALRLVICGNLLVGAWSCFAVARQNPTFASVDYPETYQAREFVFAVDKSGSMFGWDVDAPELRPLVEKWDQELVKKAAEAREQFPLLYPQDLDKRDERPKGTAEGMIQRIVAALYVEYKFLEQRPDSDRFGMFLFDDKCYWVEPLGKDRNLLMESIGEISRKQGGGTNFDGPRENTPNVGAVQTTINHFGKLGQAKVRVMVFISDGDAGIDAARHQAFVEQMTKPDEEIHIYFLLAGPKSNFTGTTADSMKKLCKAVNPKTEGFRDAVLWIGDGPSMKRAFAKINELETTLVRSDPVSQERHVRHGFILAGCAQLALFMLLCGGFRQDF